MGEPGVCPQQAPAKPRNVWALWLAVATLAAGAQAFNLLHVARAQGCDSPLLRCEERLAAFSTPDSRSYVELGRSIQRQGFLASDYSTRPAGYPLVLAASRCSAGRHHHCHGAACCRTVIVPGTRFAYRY